MAILHVGGMGLKNHFNTLQKAVVNAKPGDTIELHKDVLIENLEIAVFLTINGNNKKITTKQGLNGLMLKSDIKINDVVFPRAPKTNAIVSITDTEQTIELNNVNFIYDTNVFGKKTDSRDWFSDINVYQNKNVNLIAQNSKITYINTNLNYASFRNTKIGSFFDKKSGISASQILLQKSHIDNCQLAGDISADILNTHGLLEIYNSNVKVENLIVKKLLVKTMKSFKQAFNDESYFIDGFVGLYIENSQGIIKNVLNKIGEPVPYKYGNLSIESSNITINKDQNKAPLKSLISNSTVILTTNKKSQYTIKNSEITANDAVATGQSDAYHKLQKLIGLAPVKEQLQTFMASAVLDAKRKARGMSVNEGQLRNMVFEGNAGTGKTTVAKLVAEILFQEKVLKSKNVEIVSRQELVGQHVGETAIKTHNVIESARGGVLFIDEAYALTPTGGNDFAQEAIDQLVRDATEYKDEMIIILAGYTEDMHRFMLSNQGLDSRFPYRIEFPNYSLKELLDILHLSLKNANTFLSDQASHQLNNLFAQYYEANAQSGKLKGNGRFVEILTNKLLNTRDSRLAKEMNLKTHTDKELLTLTTDDINSTFKNL